MFNLVKIIAGIFKTFSYYIFINLLLIIALSMQNHLSSKFIVSKLLICKLISGKKIEKTF